MKIVKKINNKQLEVQIKDIEDKAIFYNLLKKIKSLPGRKWDEKLKSWIVPSSHYVLKKLKLWKFELPPDLNEKIKEKIKIIIPKNIPLFSFQKKGVEFIEKNNGRCLIADEMGCIDGEAIISINRGGISKKIKLKYIYKRFHQKDKKNYNWNKNIDTFIRCLKEDQNIFGLNKMKNIFYKGKQQVLCIKTRSGKELKLTPNHKLLNSKMNWIECQSLKIGDKIIINGISLCKKCESNKNIITYKYAKYKDYCKKCMYMSLRKNQNKIEHKKYQHSDGYIYLRGSKYHNHSRYSKSGLLEHIYIIEKHLKRKIDFIEEEVHHKNKIRNDNRIENLEIVSKTQHAKKHKTHKHFKDFIHKNGNFIITIPKTDEIIEIKKGGIIDVYDIIMENPYRNFIANNIVVHNCGKTIQAITYMEIHPEFEYILIICPASLKLNWQKEIKKWTKKESYIISSGKKDDDFYNHKIIIINYDIIKNYIDLFAKIKIDLLIVDEVHYTRNLKSQRTKAFRQIAKKTKKIIALSGTPVLNKPVEFFNILNILDSSIFHSWWLFVNRYCDPKHNGFGMTYNGSSNIEELHEIISENLMVRRLKKDVLTDLPDKLISIIPFELDNQEEYDFCFDDFKDWLWKTEKKKITMEATARIEKLKQLTIKGKLKQIKEWIDNFLETEKKLIIMCTHHVTIDALMLIYKDIAVAYDGRCNNRLKDYAVEAFQNQPDIKLFIGNIKAAGVGITLTAASDLCFVELGWIPSEHNQAMDRCHRIGQKDCVNIYYFIAKSTIEEDILQLLDEKRKIITKILDGKEIKQSDILSDLLKKIK